MSEEKKEQRAPEAPQEVTSWYIPHREHAREVVEMYVHSDPLSRRARPLPEKKRRRKGLYIFLAVLLALLAVVGIGVANTFTAGDKPSDTPSEDESDASSIVDIFGEEDITIPRADLAPHIRLSLHDTAAALTAQQVYATVADATVMVLASHGPKSSVGTGVIFHPDGYIITNAHVIAGSDSASVLLMEAYLYEAKLVGYDFEADLAVLKIDDELPFPYADFANSDDCLVGDTVYAIGNPLGVELPGTFTDGMISAVSRSVELDGRTINTIQTTAALNSGNSGGPLVNDAGQVIGINTLKMSLTGPDSGTATIEGLGFAIPSADVLFVVNGIMAEGEYRGAPSFGVTVSEQLQADGTVRIVIRTVENGGGAFNAALEPGDIILAVDGQPVANVRELQIIRRGHVLEDVVTVTIQRGEEIFDTELTMYSNL